MRKDLIELRDSAERIARAAGLSTLEWFKKPLQTDYKEDQSPVTVADRRAEEIVREMVAAEFPGHGFIGEESGESEADNEVVWVVDPIDGTRSYIHGVPFYTTLIGILIHGRPEVGVIYAPALNEMVTASTGGGTWLNGERCRARECSRIEEATFLTTDIEHIRKFGFEKPFEELLGRSRIHRTWGDAYGHLMVATGRADIMFDPVLSIWDAAALLPVVKESGGSFTDTDGQETIETGNAISCTKGLKQDVISLFEHANR